MPSPLLPIIKESSFRSSTASHNFSLGSPQYNFDIMVIYKTQIIKHPQIQIIIKKNFKNVTKMNLFLSSSSIKSVKNINIDLHIILLKHLNLTKLTQRNQRYKKLKNNLTRIKISSTTGSEKQE